MLRASAKEQNVPVNLRAVADRNIDSGVDHGELLLAFADAVTGSDHDAIGNARAKLRETMGNGALVQASAIAANFSMNDRAANAMGIPMESMFLTDTVEFREELGINAFPSARNTPDR